MVERIGQGEDGLTYVICRYGNLCTVEFDGWCSECVQFYEVQMDGWLDWERDYDY